MQYHWLEFMRGVTMEEVVQTVAMDVVRKQLAPAKIIKVTVEEDNDFDGDPILQINVVFEAEGDRLDPIKGVGLIRHMREGLGEVNEHRFPTFSFWTTEEAALEAE